MVYVLKNKNDHIKLQIVNFYDYVVFETFQNALHYASACGHVEIVKLLLDHRANVNTKNIRTLKMKTDILVECMCCFFVFEK